VEFILVFAVVFLKVFFINFLQVMQIVRTFRINTFMDDKVLTVFLWNQSIATVRTPQLHRGEPAVLHGKFCITDLTEDLPFGTIVFIEEGFGSITARAGTVIGDVALRPAADRADFLTITFFVVGNEVFVVPVLAEVGDQRELINLKFLILGRVGIIKGPLLQRNISANKLN